jgi:hypothetical protein
LNRSQEGGFTVQTSQGEACGLSAAFGSDGKPRLRTAFAELAQVLRKDWIGEARKSQRVTGSSA